jgi:hypothetical protein
LKRYSGRATGDYRLYLKEHPMKLNVQIDDTSFSLRVELTWKSIERLFKALTPVVTGIVGLMAAPEVISLGASLGWW